MAVRIRLKKLGRKHRPFFRVCAMDSRSPRDGRVIEELGTYDPMVPETDARAILKGERIDYWLGVGALPTPKVGVLIKKYGTGGTHLEAQSAAIEKLGGRRAKAIEEARAAAAAMPKPKIEEPPKEEAKTEGDAPAAEGAEEAKAETATEEKADDAKADDAKADAKPEAKEEKPAEDKPAKEEAKAEEKPAEAKAEEKAEEKRAEEKPAE